MDAQRALWHLVALEELQDQVGRRVEWQASQPDNAAGAAADVHLVAAIRADGRRDVRLRHLALAREEDLDVPRAHVPVIEHLDRALGHHLRQLDIRLAALPTRRVVREEHSQRLDGRAGRGGEPLRDLLVGRCERQPAQAHVRRAACASRRWRDWWRRLHAELRRLLPPCCLLPLPAVRTRDRIRARHWTAGCWIGDLHCSE